MQSEQYIRLARTLVAREDWVGAWDAINRELNERPERPEALYLAGCTMRAVGHYGIALTLFAKALAQETKHVNLWMNYAACLHDLNRWDEAREAFMFVHKALPDDPMPIANIASGYIQKGDNREGINWADRALKLDPDCHIARISKGFGCLGLGRWKDAWQYAEALYGNQLVVRIYNPPEKEEADWDGSKGKTVVVNADQGLGDQIMFAQCLPEMQKDCKEVIVECSERMVNFFRNNFPGVKVYGTLKEQGLEWPAYHDIDAHVHISYLGRWYRRKDSEFPRQAYVKPNPKLLAKWQAWLNQFPKPWIGIAWRGGIAQTQKHLRSLDLEDMRPVLEQPGTFIDMSYQDNDKEVSNWNLNNPTQIRKPPINLKDYEDTIALAAALDDVVTVTTSLVHVCGALGRSAKVLVPDVPQWRYQYRIDDGTGMVWYPKDSVKLYRKLPGEEWVQPIKRLARSMKEDKRAAA